MSSIDALSEFSVDWWHLADRVMLTLLHFMWQGILIGIACGLLLRCMCESRANGRYIAACVSLMALPVIFALTFCVVNVPPALDAKSAAPVVIQSADLQPTRSLAPARNPLLKSVDIDADDEFVAMNPPVAEFSQHQDVAQSNAASALPAKPKAWLADAVGSLRKFSPWAAGVYAVGVLMMFMRLVWAVQHGHCLRRAARPVVRMDLIDLVAELSKQVGLRTAPIVAYCDRVAIPCVIGVLKPVVLLPMSLLSNLSTPELSAILSHELAHIRRADLLMNFLQKIVESLLFFHPATWLISRQVSNERENCCDDVAAATCEGTIQYAAALLRMAEVCLVGSKPTLARRITALSANGAGGSQFSRRVERLLKTHKTPRFTASRMAVFSVTLLLVLGVSSVGVLAQVNDETGNEPGAQEEAGGDQESDGDQTPSQPSEDKDAAAIFQRPKIADSDVESEVLSILREPLQSRNLGSASLGAHKASIVLNLSMIGQRELVIDALMKVIKQKGTSNAFEYSMALNFVASHDYKRVLPILIKTLKDADRFSFDITDGRYPFTELRVLALLGDKAFAAVPVLIQHLGNIDPIVRKSVIESLPKIAPRSRVVIDAIAHCFDDSNADVQSTAVYQSGRYDNDAVHLGPKFAAMLASENHEVRIWAAHALIRTSADSQRGFGFLIDRLAKGEKAERQMAALALAALGRQASEIVPVLESFQDDEDKDVAREVADALRRISEDDGILCHSETARRHNGISEIKSNGNDTPVTQSFKEKIASAPNQIHATRLRTWGRLNWKWQVYLPAGTRWDIVCKIGPTDKPKPGILGWRQESYRVSVSPQATARILDLDAYVERGENSWLLFLTTDEPVFQGSEFAMFGLDDRTAEVITKSKGGYTISQLPIGRVVTKSNKTLELHRQVFGGERSPGLSLQFEERKYAVGNWSTQRLHIRKAYPLVNLPDGREQIDKDKLKRIVTWQRDSRNLDLVIDDTNPVLICDHDIVAFDFFSRKQISLQLRDFSKRSLGIETRAMLKEQSTTPYLAIILDGEVLSAVPIKKAIEQQVFIPADLDENAAKKLRDYMSETFVKCPCQSTWSKPTKEGIRLGLRLQVKPNQAHQRSLHAQYFLMNTLDHAQTVSVKIAQKNSPQKFELKPLKHIALPLQRVVQPDRLTPGSYRADQPLLELKSGWYSSQSVVRRKEDTDTPLENAELNIPGLAFQVIDSEGSPDSNMKEPASDDKPNKEFPFLSGYPQLRGLSLPLSRQKLVDVLEASDHYYCVSEDEKTIEVGTDDQHTILFTFAGDSCHGVQRMRGGTPAPDIRIEGAQVTKENVVAKLGGKRWTTVTLTDAKFSSPLMANLRQAKSIKRLRLFGEELSGHIGRLEKVNGLEELHLGSTLRLRDFESLSKLKQLRGLAFWKSAMMSVSGAKQVAKLTNLETLELYNTDMDDASFQELATLIKLRSLNISHTRITDSGIKTIENMPELRELSLIRYNVPQQLTDTAADSISTLTKLERLSLSGKFSSFGLAKIAKLPNLKHLSIAFADTAGSDLKALVNSAVEHLTVSPSQLNQSGIGYLKQCESLKTIMVKGQPTGREKKWEEQLPHLGFGYQS